MKLGKPKRYTWFKNASETCNTSPSTSTPHQNSHPVIIKMANSSSHHHQSNLVTSMSSWLLVPKGRNFRHILATVLCVILVYHVTLLAIPTNSIPSSSSSGAPEENNVNINDEINRLPSAAALTLCESCENIEEDELLGANSNQISQPQNSDHQEKQQIPIVGTSAKSGSQRAMRKNIQDEISSSQFETVQSTRNGDDDVVASNDNSNNFASPAQPAETSGNNYNYYYTDEISNRNINNYDINSPSASVAASSSDNADNASSSDNQAVTTKYGGDDNDSGHANQSEMDGNDSSNSNANSADKSNLHSPHGKDTILNSKKAMKSKGQFEKRANKRLLNLQYQKRRKLLDSIFLSIKSTKRFHKTRLEPVITTWFNLARDQTWIFTDDDDPELNQRTNGHVINTHCPSTHYRQALCCKMSAEFDTFIKSQKSWFCHFDDDNYVNVPALLDLLSKYDHNEDWYLGKPSLKIPIKIPHPDNKSEEISFWFATGGAGFCLSRALAKRMSPVASGGKFTKLCDNIQLPDDVTIGYIAGHLLGRNLTVIPQFHSHYETMRFLDMKNPYPEITFSYVRYFDNSLNTLEIDGFTEEEDPTRFLSLHCLLFPNFSFCPKSKR